jgi:hypothetical protein
VTLEVEFWSLVGMAIGFLGTIIGIVWGLIRSVLNQGIQRIDEHFSAMEKAQGISAADVARRLGAIESAAHESAGHWQRLQRELLEHEAEAARRYVHREDYVQMVATIVAKLDAAQARADAVSARLENTLLKGAKNG